MCWCISRHLTRVFTESRFWLSRPFRLWSAQSTNPLLPKPSWTRKEIALGNHTRQKRYPMTRKSALKTHAHGGVALSIATLTILIALAALAQTKGAGQSSGKASVLPVSPNSNAPLLPQGRPLLPVGSIAEVSSASRFRRGGLVAPLSQVPPLFSQPVTYAPGGTDPF